MSFTAFGQSREKAIAVIQALEVNTLDNEILGALESGPQSWEGLYIS